MKGTNRRIILGLLLIAVGVLFLLNNLGVLTVTISQYLLTWQTVIVGLGLLQLSMGNKKGGLILILVGIVLWLPVYFSIGIEQYWPILLILVGAAFFIKSQVTDQSKIAKDIDDVAILASSSKKINSKSFSGGKLSAVIGSIELDLRQSSLEHGQALLDSFSVMGGVKLYVPDDWVVNFEATNILGGFADKRAHRPTEYFGDVLTIKGFILLGTTELHS